MASVVKSAVRAVREKGIGNFLRQLRQEGFFLKNGIEVILLANNAEEILGKFRTFLIPYGNCLTDGNLLQTKIHNIGATLVGVDKFGNKYYEKLEGMQFGRHRWVEYAEKSRYNASQVPPEWHGWLHYMTDHTGDQLLMLKPQRYGIEHKENFSGEGEEFIYHSKGHALNPGQRDWTRYQSWQPTTK